MNPLQQTIEILKLRKHHLQTAINSLEQILLEQPAETQTSNGNGAFHLPPPITKKPRKQRAISPATKAPSSGRIDSFDPALLKTALGLAEPFNAVSLGEATNMRRADACNRITRWKAEGWLKKEGRGLYRRTPNFGKGHAVPSDKESSYQKLRESMGIKVPQIGKLDEE